VFFVASRIFRDTIVLDRRSDILKRGLRTIGRLSDVQFVEIDDTPRVQVMNEMALIFQNGRRFSLLLYDGRADAGLHAAAERIALFIGRPVKVRVDEWGFHKKPR